MTQKWMISTLLSGVLLVSGAQAAQAMTLKEAMEGAYGSNPRLSAARAQLEGANEQISQAVSNWRPVVNAGVSRGRERARTDNQEFNIEDSRAQTLSVEQPLFEGGANFTRYSAAKNNVLAERENLRNTEQLVLFDTVVAYMGVVEAHSVLELSKGNEEVLTQQLQASNDRFEVGEITRTDVAQSKSRLALAKSDRIQARGNLVTALAEYERVIGAMPTVAPQLPQYFPELPASLEDAVDIAVRNSPALRAANYTAEAADDDVDTAIGALLPQVSIIGTLSRAKGAALFGTADVDNDEVRLNVDIPIYQGGAEHSNVRQSKKLARQTVYNRKDTEESVREAAIQTWQGWKTSLATIESQQEAIRAAEIALEGVRQEQQFGSRTVLDVLDAEQELFSARVELVGAQRARVVAIYNLLSVLGELTAEKLALNVDFYDPREDYNDVKWQFIGW